MESQYYKHFKGGLYQLLYIAKNSETMENMVVYRSILDENAIWVRPEKMFFETIIVNNASCPRFKAISKQELEQELINIK